jgi:ribose transport system ATP-binding protein
VVGAVTLTLIGALLGMLDIPSNLNPATQGLLLLAILAVRSLSAPGEGQR